MKMALRGNTILIKECDNVQFSVIKSWGKMRWNRSEQMLTGAADTELLDKLAGLVRLPPSIEARRAEQHAIAEAMDAERMNPDPTPFYPYPVKTTMFLHQIRGANMAMLTFGFTTPEQAAAIFEQEAAEKEEVMQNAERDKQPR